MSYIPDSQSIISTTNSTNSPLGSLGAFSGSFEDVSQYSLTTVNLGVGSPTSCSGSLIIEFSQDGSTTDRLIVIPVEDISSPSPGIHTFVPIARYFRVRFDNSTTVQTQFRLQTIHHKNLSKLPTSRISQTTSEYSDVDNVRAILSAQLGSGKIKPINSTPEGHLETEIHGPVTTYGAVRAESSIPGAQVDFAYGQGLDFVLTASFVNGRIGFTDGLATVSTSTDVGSVASVISRRIMLTRPGQGVETTFSAFFSPPVENSLQIAGPVSTTAGAAFGYNGTSFGVLYRTGGVREVQTLSVSVGTGGTPESATITLDGVLFDLTIPGSLTTTGVANFIASSSFFPTVTSSAARGYGWDSESIGNTVTFISRRAFNHTGLFRFVSSGTATGSFTKLVSGIAQTDTWTSQSSWNVDKMDGSRSSANPSGFSLNPTKGNVYKIAWQANGFGHTEFYVENTTGELELVHRNSVAGQRNTPIFTTPSSRFSLIVASQGSTTPISASCSTIGIFSQGVVRRLGNKRSLVNGKTNVGTSYVPILSIRNSYLKNLKNNFTIMFLTQLSAATEGTKNCNFVLLVNPVLTGVPSWTAVDSSSSPVHYDTSATGVSGGSQKYAFSLSKSTATTIDLTNLDFTISPGEILTLAAKSTSGTSDIDMSISWIED